MSMAATLSHTGEDLRVSLWVVRTAKLHLYTPKLIIDIGLAMAKAGTVPVLHLGSSASLFEPCVTESPSWPHLSLK